MPSTQTFVSNIILQQQEPDLLLKTADSKTEAGSIGDNLIVPGSKEVGICTDDDEKEPQEPMLRNPND
jgi:hypothetical protein